MTRTQKEFCFLKCVFPPQTSHLGGCLTWLPPPLGCKAGVPPLRKQREKKKKRSILWWQTGSHPGRHRSEGRAGGEAQPVPPPSPSSRQGQGGCEKQAVTPKAGARVYEPRHLSLAHARVEAGDWMVRGEREKKRSTG